MKQVLVTGGAGFIGFHILKKIVNENYNIVIIDNINNYYDINLKIHRLKLLGFHVSKNSSKSKHYSKIYENLIFYRLDLIDKKKLIEIFEKYNFKIVCHLAAQPGVRYSLENPDIYIERNINCFFNVLDCSRIFKVNHFIYASSSSVYGNSKDFPFDESQFVDKPVSLYAATKKTNELLAHTYSHLYNLKTTGLRFFTVYGPLGRPDMAYYIFSKAIYEGKKIKIFNNGDLNRDYTFINDIVEACYKIIVDDVSKRKSYKIYNVGNTKTEKLKDLIDIIEKLTTKKFKKQFLPMQKGDVYVTLANVKNLIDDYDFKPNTSLENGIKLFINWYKSFHSIN